MSLKVKITWDNVNVVSESVRIYRADSIFASVTLPPLLAEIFGDVDVYEDLAVHEGLTYYYMLSAKLGDQEVFTECFSVVAQSSYSPRWENVKALILADAASYPSYNIIDKTGTASILSIDGVVQVSKSEFWTGGAFLINQNAGRVEINSPSYSFGVADFVVECEFLLSSEAVTSGFYWGIINIGSVYGEMGRSIDMGILSGVLYVSIRPNAPSGYAVNYDAQVSVEANTKYHLAIMRKFGIVYFFLNGVVIYTLTESISLTRSYIRFCQGGGVTSRYLNSIRVSIEAFYSEKGFIPPTQYPTQ